MSDAPLLLPVALGVALGAAGRPRRWPTRGLARREPAPSWRPPPNGCAAATSSSRNSAASSNRSATVPTTPPAAPPTSRPSSPKPTPASTRSASSPPRNSRFSTDAEKKLADSFARLSQQALVSNSASFLTLARQSFETLQAAAQGDLEGRRQAIEGLVAPIKEKLGEYELGIRELENARKLAYGGLAEQVRGLAQSQESLLRETGKLVTALRRPEVRGNWGEVQLRRVVEFAGMVEHVDFRPQESVDTDDGRLRPDLTVFLPGDKEGRSRCQGAVGRLLGCDRGD